MSLYFAYGSNMSRALMRRRCPGAQPLGLAVLDGWRFVISRDGYASIVPRPGSVVHGVLWRIGPRELAALNAYESVASGLYRRLILPVCWNGSLRPALVYVGRTCTPGRPRPGYLQTVIAAARDWGLPEAYIGKIERLQTSRWGGVRGIEAGEIG